MRIGKKMKPKKWALFLCITALFAGLSRHSANADLCFITESVTNNVPNQPNGTSVQKNYFTSGACRLELGNSKVIILDYKAMKMYSIDPGTKTYTEQNLGELPGLPDVSAANKGKMGEALGALLAVQVTPTDEFKTIEGYRCRKYYVNAAMMNAEYWVSKDVKGYKELRSIGAKWGAITERNPMLRQINVAGMVEKLDGFPVYTVNRVMGGTVELTLKNIEQKSLAPALFIVPKDYTLRKSK